MFCYLGSMLWFSRAGLSRFAFRVRIIASSPDAKKFVDSVRGKKPLTDECPLESRARSCWGLWWWLCSPFHTSWFKLPWCKQFCKGIFVKRLLEEFGEVTVAFCPNKDGKPSMDLPSCFKTFGIDVHLSAYRCCCCCCCRWYWDVVGCQSCSP